MIRLISVMAAAFSLSLSPTAVQAALSDGDSRAQAQQAYDRAAALGRAGRYAEALPYLRRAAAADLPAAQYSLGALYSSGNGVPQSRETARQWYEKAAAQGHADAAFNLGIHYDQGLDVRRSDTTALRWFMRAGELGHAKGAYNAGHLYLQQAGSETSISDAYRWFRIAADADLDEGMNAVGYAYRHGLGVEMDWPQARSWFVRAAEKGSTVAVANLQEMTTLSLNAAVADEKNGRAFESSTTYIIGCDYSHFLACLHDGRTAYFGIGRPVDYVRARQSYGKACFEGIDQACLGHARSAVRAPGSAEETRIAAERLEQACTDKDYNACHLLAYMHWHDDLFHMYDITKVKRYLARACQDGGMQDSCTAVFSIISAETAASGASRRPPRRINPIEQFLLNSTAVVLGTMNAMGQAPLSTYRPAPTGRSAVDAVALNNARQDRRDFNNYIRQIDAGARVAVCRPGNPYC